MTAVILLPCVPLILLFLTATETFRRAWLAFFAVTLLGVLLWGYLLNVAAPDSAANVAVSDAVALLFKDSESFVLKFFVSGMWSVITYVLVLAAGGYLANRHALLKLKKAP